MDKLKDETFSEIHNDKNRDKDNDKKNHYVDNKRLAKELYEYRVEFLRCKEEELPRPKPSEYIGACILKIARGLANKPSFYGYTYNEEMVADGIENCLKGMHNFNPEKTNNAFSYLTQIIYYAFLRRIQKEKRQQDIKKKYVKKVSIGEIDGFTLNHECDDTNYNNTLVDYAANFYDQYDKDNE